jgi:BMFP domain-containing protein YqiC
MPDELEARVSALETRIEEVALDAKAARHLAAARDRDLADLTIKVDAHRKAISALGVQTAERFDRLERRFDGLEAKVDAGFAEVGAKFEQVDRNFTEMRAKFDQSAAGMQRIVDLLTSRPDGA